MITDNQQKKALVEKLLQDKVISIDDAFMLLDEQATGPVPFGPYIPAAPFPPQYPYDFGKVYVGDFPYSVGTGSITSVSGNCSPTIVATHNGTTTDTVHYTEQQWAHMLSTGQISYTTGIS